DEFESSRPDRGLNALRERLQKANYEVKGLQLVPKAAGKKDDPRMVMSDKVPEDAAAVGVAGPRPPFSAEAPAARTEDMNRTEPKTQAKTGKLVVLLDVLVNRDGTMVRTGIEKWLEDYNVEVGVSRVVTAHEDPVTEILVTPNARLRGNPVAQAFA